MSIQTLDKIFKPQRIALVGVTPNPKSVGGKILTNLVGGGFRGRRLPRQPRRARPSWASPASRDVADLPKDARPGHHLRRRRPGARPRPGMRRGGHPAASSSSRPASGRAGPEGKALEDEIRGSPPPLRRHADHRAQLPGHHLARAASSTPASPRPCPGRGTSPSSPSPGALCTSVLDWAVEEKIGFSHFVSIGNTLDVDFGDLIDYFGEDEETKSIILYIESIDRRPEVHDRRPGLRPDEAHRRLQGRPLPGIRRRRPPPTPAPWPARTPSTTRPSSASAWPASSTSARSSTVAELVGRHKVPQGARPGHRHQRRRPRRHGHRRPDRGGRRPGPPLRRNDGQARTRASRRMWSRRNPVDVLGDAKSKLVAKAVRIVLQTPASTPSSSSSRPRP